MENNQESPLCLTVKLNINSATPKKLTDLLQSLLNSCGLQNSQETAANITNAVSTSKGICTVLEGSKDVDQLELSVYKADEAKFVRIVESSKRFIAFVPQGKKTQWISALLTLRRLGYARWMHCLLAMKRVKFGTEGDLAAVQTHLEERNKVREEKKALRMEKRKRNGGEERPAKRRRTREERRKVQEQRSARPKLESLAMFPADATHLLLDANNMAFVSSTLRSLFLNKRANGPKDVEDIIFLIAKDFAAKFPKLQHVVVFFDGKTKPRRETLADGSVIELIGTHPRIADDVLVEWVQQHKDYAAQTAVATSDRELRQRLRQGGVVFIMGSKNWLKIANAALMPNNSDLESLVKSARARIPSALVQQVPGDELAKRLDSMALEK